MEICQTIWCLSYMQPYFGCWSSTAWEDFIAIVSLNCFFNFIVYKEFALVYFYNELFKEFPLVESFVREEPGCKSPIFFILGNNLFPSISSIFHHNHGSRILYLHPCFIMYQVAFSGTDFFFFFLPGNNWVMRFCHLDGEACILSAGGRELG